MADGGLLWIKMMEVMMMTVKQVSHVTSNMLNVN